jgi:putative SOS response-associated peptidase YedK
MTWKDLDQFYIAGFYDVYKHGSIGFGLVTTIPNPTQAEIHNRMIITLNPKMGKAFLDRDTIENFQFPNFSPDLFYKNLEPEKLPNTLF